MGQALYRKYRSKSLSEIVGQEHITRTLEQALEQGRISHAYLFTGPRGVGKTSIARIWAHEINGLPYTDDSNHLDIIEIDAASNRRIDEIRELRDKVYIAPTSAKYKVYIIDEVHMLTKEAFNALLKTLEEPPEHAVFILATTDVHKLPETIISRTQRYNFRPAEPEKVVDLLRYIAKAEKLSVDNDALALLAEHGGGSFRDSVSLLDQASSNGQTVDATAVQRLLGIPSAEAINELLDYVMEGAEPATLMGALTALYEQGFQAAAIASRLGQAIRGQLTAGGVSNYDQAFTLLGELIEVPVSHYPERRLEIVLLQAQPKGTRPQPRTKPVAAKPAPTPASTPEPIAVEAEPEPVPVVEMAAEAEGPVKIVAGTAVFDEAVWPSVLQTLKQRHNTLYGVVRMAQPSFGDGNLKLAFNFAFHQKRISEPTNRQKLTDIITELTGTPVIIECVVDTDVSAPNIKVPAAPVVADNDIAAISNIFGGAELLE